MSDVLIMNKFNKNLSASVIRITYCEHYLITYTIDISRRDTMTTGNALVTALYKLHIIIM